MNAFIAAAGAIHGARSGRRRAPGPPRPPATSWKLLQSAGAPSPGATQTTGTATLARPLTAGSKLLVFISSGSAMPMDVRAGGDSFWYLYSHEEHASGPGGGGSVTLRCFAQDVTESTTQDITVTAAESTNLSFSVQEVAGLVPGDGCVDAGPQFAAGNLVTGPVPGPDNYASSRAGGYLVTSTTDTYTPAPGAMLTAPHGYTLDPNSVNGNIWTNMTLAYAPSTGGLEPEPVWSRDLSGGTVTALVAFLAA